jgi:hypothetical protein
MNINYNNIFHSKALQIYPNWDFWFEKMPSGNPATSVVDSNAIWKCRIMLIYCQVQLRSVPGWMQKMIPGADQMHNQCTDQNKCTPS